MNETVALIFAALGILAALVFGARAPSRKTCFLKDFLGKIP